MNIGQAFQESGASQRMIRPYETIALIPAPARRGSGYRDGCSAFDDGPGQRSQARSSSNRGTTTFDAAIASGPGAPAITPCFLFRCYSNPHPEFVASDRWLTLAAKGAMPQRLLWASTSTKNAAYPDVLYLDRLVGRDTVNTAPPKTLEALRNHGTVAPTLTADLVGAHQIIADAERLGLDLNGFTAMLVDEGVHGLAMAFEDFADGDCRETSRHGLRLSVR